MIKRIRALPEVATLVSVVSHVPDSPGAAYCRENEIPLFDSVDGFLSHGGFEVVYNPTPIHVHGRLALASMEAGYSVWMEKPPLATIQEFDQILKISKSRGTSIGVCFNSLFSKLTQDLKAGIVAGRFGAVKRVKGIGAWIRDTDYFTRSDWAGKLQLGEDWILDGDVNNPFAHVLCNNLYFASVEANTLAQPVSVQAELYRCNPIESEDTSCLRIITTDGIEIVNCLTLGPSEEIPPRTEIETEQARIVYNDFKHLTIQYKDGRVETFESEREDRLQMVEHLCRAYREGRPYISTLDMVRPFTLCVNAAFESAQCVKSIPKEYVEVDESGCGRYRVKDMNHWIETAFSKTALYSEIGVPWAQASAAFCPVGYERFPIQFKA